MPNHYDFQGRVALVTGGASGIGRATVERLRQGGATVVVFDRDPSADIRGDIARSADLDAAVAEVEARHGR
ncbi:MAG: 3-oxoacyl-ACP reductase, partial [Chloroflexota bacterium]